MIISPYEQSLSFFHLLDSSKIFVEHTLHVARIQFQTQAEWPCAWYSGLSYDCQFVSKRILAFRELVWRWRRIWLIQKFRLWQLTQEHRRRLCSQGVTIIQFASALKLSSSHENTCFRTKFTICFKMELLTVKVWTLWTNRYLRRLNLELFHEQWLFCSEECNNEEKDSDNGLQDQRVWSPEECASIFRQRLVLFLCHLS